MLNIQTGQIYLDETKNEYLIVTKTNRGRISYAGPGFQGAREDEDFIQEFLPVNPVDVEKTELAYLVSLCETGTTPKVGLIVEEV